MAMNVISDKRRAMFVKTFFMAITVIILISFSVTTSLAWLIYHKPAFKGKLIDSETKEPIEGALVMVVYEKQDYGIGPDSSSLPFDAREVFTDNKGMFHTPSYTTVISPFSGVSFVRFKIYKPGYGQFFIGQHVNGSASLDVNEVFFSEKMYGKKERFKLWLKKGDKYELDWAEVMCGVVELPRLKTREERLRFIPDLPFQIDHLEKQENLVRLINEEYERFGIEKTDPYKAREFMLKHWR